MGKICHPDEDEVKDNSFEGNEIGSKTASNPCFNIHIDRMNSKGYKQYCCTAVMSTVVERDKEYFFPFPYFTTGGGVRH
eukprot:13261446-Ditylum_brightwellii.AAC.1